MTSISGEEMRRLGIVNVSDALTQLVPQNISTYTPTMTGDDQAGRGGGGMEGLDRGSFFIGQTVANLRGLDPTFGSRTLTLIDGRRVVSSSNQADVVDLNIIPSNLLDRVDVVTGGASATYGSGAVAGVVNLVLNHRLEGVNLDMDYGVTEAGDGSSPHIALSGGTTLLEGRGHVLVGAEWQKTQAIRDCAAARAWCAESRQLFTNQSGGSTALTDARTALPGFDGLPARFEMANVRFSQFAPTGTIYVNDASVTSDYRFSDDGTKATEYSLGYRGGAAGMGNAFPNPTSAMNGDGPPDHEQHTAPAQQPAQDAVHELRVRPDAEHYGLRPGEPREDQCAERESLHIRRLLHAFRLGRNTRYECRCAVGTAVLDHRGRHGQWAELHHEPVRAVQYHYRAICAVPRHRQFDGCACCVVGLLRGQWPRAERQRIGSHQLHRCHLQRQKRAWRCLAVLDTNSPAAWWPPAFTFNGNAVGKWVKFSFSNWGAEQYVLYRRLSE